MISPQVFIASYTILGGSAPPCYGEMSLMARNYQEVIEIIDDIQQLYWCRGFEFVVDNVTYPDGSDAYDGDKEDN